MLSKGRLVSYTYFAFGCVLLAREEDTQFEIAFEKVRDLAHRRLCGAIGARDFKREIGSLNPEIGPLGRSLLKASLEGKGEPAEDSDGRLFGAT